MSNAQNLAYSVIQIFHNFGAVATVGGSLAAIKGAEGRKKFAWLAFAGWGTQVLSGAFFAMVSYHYYHRLPDIAGIALVALSIKMLCAASGLLLVASCILWGERWQDGKTNAFLFSSLVMSAIALTSAAFLRWFS